MITDPVAPGACAHCGHAKDKHEWKNGYAVCDGAGIGECDCDGTHGPLDPDYEIMKPDPSTPLSGLAKALAEYDALEERTARAREGKLPLDA